MRGEAVHDCAASLAHRNSSPLTTKRTRAIRRRMQRRFRGVVTLYKASDDYKNLAASTRRNWAPHGSIE